LVLKQALDVIDGEVLLTRLHDACAHGIRFRCLLRAFSRRQEKGLAKVLTKVVNQDAKTALRIAKAAGGILGRELVDKESAQGFVLAVGGIGGLQEDLGRIS